MSDDWNVGDLALCVNRDGWFDAATNKVSSGLPYGWTGTVRRVWVQCGAFTMLVFDEGNPHGYSAKQFRKIKPDAHEGNADDWQLILETSKPKAPSPKERETRILEALFPSGEPK